MTINDKATIKSHDGIVALSASGGESFDPSTLIVDANAKTEA